MSHTNVYIEDQFSSKRRLLDENELLRFKLKQAEDKLTWLYDELANIPKALKEWGHVDFLDANGNKILTAIPKPEETADDAKEN